MHVTIKVTGLTLGQWDHLQDNLMASYKMSPGAVRVCAEFELTPDLGTRHVEMPIRAFAGLMVRLERIEAHAVIAQAMLTPDALPDTEAGQDPLPVGDHSVCNPRTCAYKANN